MQGAQPELANFADAAALLAFLHDAVGNPMSKNRVLRALVQCAQREAPTAQAATTLLLLALWPGLDACRSRLFRHFQAERDRLVAELTGRLSVAIATLDLDRVHRIAATLLRNVERDLKRALVREWVRSEVGDVADVPAAEPARSPEQVLAELRNRLGRDAALVFLVEFAGLSQKEAARALGLTYAATRKRHQRALQRLNDLLERDDG